MFSGFLGLIAIVTSAGPIASGSVTLTTRCAAVSPQIVTNAAKTVIFGQNRNVFRPPFT